MIPIRRALYASFASGAPVRCAWPCVSPRVPENVPELRVRERQGVSTGSDDLYTPWMA